MATFDPNHPQNGDEIEADLLRNNFNALNDRISGIPAGPQGEQGPPGADGRSIVNVRDSGDGRAIVVMSDGAEYGPFSIATGPQGERGSDGGPGPEGPAGPVGPAGNDGRGIANVRDSGDGTGRCFVDMTDGTTYGPFTIATGPAGMNGNDGRGISNIRDNGDGTLTVDYTDGNTAGPFAMPAGPQGPQGNPGEVSAQQLSDAISGTSANSNTIQLLNLTVSDPPTQSELQAVANKLDELIQALRR